MLQQSACSHIGDAPRCCPSGHLPDDDDIWAACSLSCRNLSNNAIVGTLPASWGAPGVFASLSTLNLDSNLLSGGALCPQPCMFTGCSVRQSVIPRHCVGDLGPVIITLSQANPTLIHLSDAQGRSHQPTAPTEAFLALTVLDLGNNHLNGSLPSAYGSDGALPSLQVCARLVICITAKKPSSTDSCHAFIRGCRSCVGIKVTHLNERQSQGWSVLQVLNLKTNRLSGSLPGSWGGSLAAFPNLTLLALDDNQIKGSLPAAWSAGWPQPLVCSLSSLDVNSHPSCLGFSMLPLEAWRGSHPRICQQA